MTKLPYVSSEGGPLLIGSGNALRHWGGASAFETDHKRACDVVKCNSVGCLDSHILVWDIGGAGTAFLTHYDDRKFHLVRFWADDEPDDEIICSMVQLTKPTGGQSSFHIASSPAIVVWACEELTGMDIRAESIPGVPKGSWSMGGTVYCFPVTPGRYSAEVGHFESKGLIIVSLTCALQVAEEIGAPSNK